jgi:hypothetical protein
MFGERSLNMQPFDSQPWQGGAARRSFGRTFVVGEINVTDFMASPGQFPAELHPERMPAEFINEDAHR